MGEGCEGLSLLTGLAVLSGRQAEVSSLWSWGLLVGCWSTPRWRSACEVLRGLGTEGQDPQHV